jgi:hypothetical protein
MATRGYPTYSVEILEQGGSRNTVGKAPESLVLTLYWVKLPQPIKEWWYSDRLKRDVSLSAIPPSPAQRLVVRSTSSGAAAETNTDG